MKEGKTFFERHEHIGVEEEVASFVLPIGATINMDGTSLYQACFHRLLQ